MEYLIKGEVTYYHTIKLIMKSDGQHTFYIDIFCRKYPGHEKLHFNNYPEASNKFDEIYNKYKDESKLD